MVHEPKFRSIDYLKPKKDKSVLENHHLYIAYTILENENCNILSKLSKEEWEYFRYLVVGKFFDFAFNLRPQPTLVTYARKTRLFKKWFWQRTWQSIFRN